MKRFSAEQRESIVIKALNRKGESVREIALANDVGFSTLQKWLRAYREGNPSGHNQPLKNKQPGAKKLQFLLDTASLDEKELGAYCRKHGIFSHQLNKWKAEFMSSDNQQKRGHHDAELKRLKNENKQLKKELNRKDKALAETSALLILKKKANLIWGTDEDD